MTIEDAIKMMGVLESLDDGTLKSAERIGRLNELLLKDPARFWDEFWSQVNENDPIRKQAESMFNRLGSDATFADMKKAVEEDAVKNPNRDGDDK